MAAGEALAEPAANRRGKISPRIHRQKRAKAEISERLGTIWRDRTGLTGRSGI
jgi:hypothetical protein